MSIGPLLLLALASYRKSRQQKEVRRAYAVREAMIRALHYYDTTMVEQELTELVLCPSVRHLSSCRHLLACHWH
jgi:hypothetical protein